MKPIVIKPENATLLQDAITTAEGKAKERIVSAEDLIHMTAGVDAKLAQQPRTAIEGVSVKLDLHAQTSDRGTWESTQLTILYSAGSWQLTHVTRDLCGTKRRQIIQRYDA